MIDEIWLPVIDYEERYLVSNLGQVKSLLRQKLLSQSKSYDGYHEVNLCKDGKYRTVKVHRLVAQMFLETWNPELEVNHKDGNKDNNCVDNLEMVTHQGNMDHYWKDPVFAEHRKKYSAYAKEAMTERWSSKEFRDKVQSVFNSPEYKQAHSEAGKKVYADLSMRNKASEHSKDMWAAEGFHDKQIEAIKQGWSDPDKRRKASERLQGLVWMTAPDGTYCRILSDQVEDKLSEGHSLGRIGNNNIGGKVSVFCAKNGKMYDSMTACEKDLGLESGDVHYILKGVLPKRLSSIQADLQLSLVENRRRNNI